MKSHGVITFGLFIGILTIWGMILPAYGQETVKPGAAKPVVAKPEVAKPEVVKPASVPIASADFKIKRLLVCAGIENSEPVGVSETFPATTEKVYCFLEATHITTDTEVSIVWSHGQKELLKYNLPLRKGSRWRTYACKNLMGLKGDWKVEVKNTAGNVFQEVLFKIE